MNDKAAGTTRHAATMSTEQTQQEAKKPDQPARRPWQFSLFQLFVVVTFCAALIAYLGTRSMVAAVVLGVTSLLIGRWTAPFLKESKSTEWYQALRRVGGFLGGAFLGAVVAILVVGMVFRPQKFDGDLFRATLLVGGVGGGMAGATWPRVVAEIFYVISFF